MNEKMSGLLASCTYEIMGVKQVDQKQFAELVVQETLLEMAIRMDSFGDNQANNPAWYKSEEAVRKCFGVKE